MLGKILTGTLLALVMMPAPAQAGPIEDIVDAAFGPTDCVFDSECGPNNPCQGGGCSPCDGGNCDTARNAVDYYTRDDNPRNHIPDWIERAAFECSASGGAHTFTVQFTAVCAVTTGSSTAAAAPRVLIIAPCDEHGHEPESYCAVRGISKAVARFGDDGLNGTSIRELEDNTYGLVDTVQECLDESQGNPNCPQILH